MAEKRKSPSESEPTKRRPRGKTGGTIPSATPNGRGRRMKAARNGTSAATIPGNAAKPAKKTLRAASASKQDIELTDRKSVLDKQPCGLYLTTWLFNLMVYLE